MLRCINPKNLIRVPYLASIDVNVFVGVIPLKGFEVSMKLVKETKKKKYSEKPQPFQEPMMEEVSKEIIPLNTGILKHTKKSAKRPRHSQVRPSVQEPEIDTTEQNQSFTPIRMINHLHPSLRRLLSYHPEFHILSPI